MEPILLALLVVCSQHPSSFTPMFPRQDTFFPRCFISCCMHMHNTDSLDRSFYLLRCEWVTYNSLPPQTPHSCHGLKNEMQLVSTACYALACPFHNSHTHPHAHKAQHVLQPQSNSHFECMAINHSPWYPLPPLPLGLGLNVPVLFLSIKFQIRSFPRSTQQSLETDG